MTNSMTQNTSSDMTRRFIGYTEEQAMADVAKLDQKETTDHGGVILHTGVHPEHGPVHIIIPAMGESLLLLPFVIQSL